MTEKTEKLETISCEPNWQHLAEFMMHSLELKLLPSNEHGHTDLVRMQDQKVISGDIPEGQWGKACIILGGIMSYRGATQPKCQQCDEWLYPDPPELCDTCSCDKLSEDDNYWDPIQINKIK